MLMTTPTSGWRGLAGRFQRLAAHPLAVPILLACLLFAIGAQVACLFSIPSWSNDEPAHLGYIATLSDGRLPTIDSPSGFPGRDEQHGHIWTANHPPAFHLLMVPVWELFSGDVGSAVVAMRLINTFGFAVWLLLVALVARELVPDRPAVTALATVVALAPTLALRSGFLINDGLGSSAALLMMLMAVRMLRGEFTPRRAAIAAVAGSIAAGTRAPGVLIVAACFVAVLIVGIRRHGWLRGTTYAGVLGGVPALATGWFYVRNHNLYGDFTGQDALLEKFGRAPVDSLNDVLALRTVQETFAASPVPLLALTVLGPIVLVSAIRRYGWRPGAAWLMLAGHATLTAVNVTTFILDGGGFHDRYFMQVMPLLGTVTALGMLRVADWLKPSDRSAEQRDWLVASGWSAVLLLWLAGTLWWIETRYSFYYPDLHAHSPVDGPTPYLFIGLAGLLGLAVVAAMLSRAVSPMAAPIADPVVVPEQPQIAEPVL
jgi:hypothetical protein